MIEGYRLSPQQEHLWQLQHGELPGPYRAQCAIRMEGFLDASLLHAALYQVVQCHEILRTAFDGVSGMTLPLQVIAAPALPACDHDDLSTCPAPEQPARIEARWQEMLQQPVNLSRAPLLRLALLKLAPARHLLLVSIPALCADTATLQHLVHEIGRAYAACLQGTARADVPMQYADFAEWQHTLLAATEGETNRAYWRQQTLPTPGVRLPFALQRPAGADFVPRSLSLALAPELLTRAARLAQPYGLAAADVFLACWQLVLWRLTGQSDVMVGVAYAGRRYEPLHNALGLFARHLPIRCHLAASLQPGAILVQLQEASREAYQRQEYFNWEHLDFLPLCFEYIEPPAAQVSANVSFALERQSTCMDRFQVKLTCMQHTDALISVLHYDASLFQATAIGCLGEQFRTLCAEVLAHPDVAISQLRMLSATERQQVVSGFNRTRVEFPQGACLHHLFEAQSARTPERIAVVSQDHCLTYAALNARANRLAHALQKLGVGPEVCVGICVERSLELVVGLLGILKAGAAYVPLDPAYPAARLAFMLADAQLPVLVTQERLGARLPDHQAQVVYLDGDRLASASTANLRSGVTPANLAYVMYTSGSTGQPKGVQITHAQAVHSTQARLAYYRDPVRCFLLLSSFAFDSSVAGIFWTLSQGGTLVLPQEGSQGDVARLADLLPQQQVSHLLSLPSLYDLVLEHASPRRLASLQTVIVAGEACPVALPTRHHARLPRTGLYNEYGPTEGTVWSSVYQSQAQECKPVVPIGRPIANMQIYLLDTRLQPVGIGLPGEVYIGGHGLARGYLKRSPLTAERFIAHPFSAVPGLRLYKTGDVARYWPDGELEFLGRLDHQVKLRGYRIEPGEIEAILTQHPAVQEAVVMAQEGVAGSLRLVAFVVLDQQQVATVAELRRFVEIHLPAYMVPAGFVLLAAWPLTPNGKIDRQALLALDQARPASEPAYVPPRTAIEEVLADIWADMLGMDRVGLHDNFFALGGHSLLATRVIARVCATLQLELPLRLFFEAATVAELARVILEHEAQTGQTEKLARLLRQVQGMSAEAVQQRLQQTHSEVAR
jgi:amino acid adenylation domain-containing protein